ncbi:MAG TPA: response regulator transcription factor [Candidatus Limnocylindria bacterium]
MARITMDEQPDVVATSVVVLDPLGEIFDRLRELELTAALWRVLDAKRISPGLDLGLTICAAYGPVSWDDVSKLTQRAPGLIITTAYDRDEAQEALQRDLIGYLDAAMPHEALDRAIRGALSRGEPAFPREVIGAWMRSRRQAASGERNGSEGLTRRQQEIMSLISRGATDKEIAAVLGIAQATAQKHVTNILQRLHVPNRAAAVAVISGPRRFI